MTELTMDGEKALTATTRSAAGPDFFVVGAAKSGTTALDAYLGAHPEISMGLKEMHYFGSDLAWGPMFRRFTFDEYLSAFPVANGVKRVGETSPGYLYSARAAEEIKRYRPDAQIIALLRNPVDMIHAFHSHQVYVGDENIKDLERALTAEPDRKEGRRVPWSNTGVWALCYRDVVRYAEQLERYLEAFGPDRVHVVLYDDFRADTAAAYRGTLEFLGVDRDFRPRFDALNPSKRARVRTISAAISASRATPKLKPAWSWRAIRKAGRIAIPSRRARTALSEWVEQANTVPGRLPLRPELRARLEADLADEVRQLGALLGRNLSHWLGEARLLGDGGATQPRRTRA